MFMSEPIKSIQKMFKILECFTEAEELSIKDVQENTNFPKSTIFRILATLEKLDYIKQNPDNHRYALGFKFFHLGSIVQNSFDFRKTALPIMTKLAQETYETIDLNIVNGCERICIDKVDSPETVRNFVSIGQRNPLHLGGSGKLLLAYLSTHQQEICYQKISIDEETKKKLNKELETIRKKGYSITEEERIKGSFAISAPIYDFSGKVIAGLTIAGPIQRLSETHKNKLIQSLLTSSQKISTLLGHKQA